MQDTLPITEIFYPDAVSSIGWGTQNPQDPNEELRVGYSDWDQNISETMPHQELIRRSAYINFSGLDKLKGQQISALELILTFSDDLQNNAPLDFFINFTKKEFNESTINFSNVPPAFLGSGGGNSPRGSNLYRVNPESRVEVKLDLINSSLYDVSRNETTPISSDLWRIKGFSLQPKTVEGYESWDIQPETFGSFVRHGSEAPRLKVTHSRATMTNY